MKLKNIFKYTAAMALSVTMLGACTGDFEELNTNPYEVDPSVLPFDAQFSTPLTYSYPPHQNLFQYWTSLSIDNYGGYFEVPHSNWTMARYSLNRGFCGGMHENFMQKIFNNTRRLIKQCDESEMYDIAAVARIVEVYNLLQYTDTYGPVPYSSVIAADEMPERPSSYAYDKQEDIYKAMFAQIDEAIAGLDTTTDGLANFDVWCKGDRSLWKKVANQLKLRMAIRIVKIDPTNAQKYAQEAITAGVLTDQDILISDYSNELRRMMDWWDSGIGSSIVTVMNGFNDPRRPLYFTTNVRDLVKETAVAGSDGEYKKEDILIAKGEQYIGVPVGCELGNKNGGNDNQRVYYSFLAGSYSTPLPIMFAAEGWFLRAEAKLRWNIGSESVQELYETGIRTSIKNQYAYRKSTAAAAWSEKGLTAPNMDNIADDATINAYINGTTTQEDYVDPWKSEYNSEAPNKLCVKWDEGASNEDKLARIIMQKWIANYPLSVEAWADYRRTGYPKLFRPKMNLDPSTIDTELGPRRLIYSETELSANTAEVEKGIELLKAESSEVKGSGDTGGTRLWWDVKDKSNF
ncbi:SusD/RagB family nutrient-binding outer membrane lipoprotein [uncultured Alistipes sp.]|uniref:SusD/RagB family nutrient-binding outer membrane lipoprotein n=1 Tax=uncultured Alistipes sp. TaxID=538949 RepID=UPI002629FDA4|nr:SusD/RagB family nutrient-binding outer membrane lipoprotein [uncultured Alistipes sp.]